ncbi:MAG: hypothetical protein ACREOC_18325 [Gemmatimonadales bacterium]
MSDLLLQRPQQGIHHGRLTSFAVGASAQRHRIGKKLSETGVVNGVTEARLLEGPNAAA